LNYDEEVPVDGFAPIISTLFANYGYPDGTTELEA